MQEVAAHVLLWVLSPGIDILYIYIYIERYL